MKKVLWIGPVVHPNEVAKFNAISPAANKWQMSLISCLQALSCEIKILSYIPYAIFPKSKFYVFSYNSGSLKIPNEQIGYFNIPFIRNFSLFKNYLSTIKKEKEFDVVITYNNSFQNKKIGKYLKKLDYFWISIVADGNYIEGPDFTVFLSYGYWQKATLKNKIHIDGGIEKFIGSELCLSKRKIIIFSGALNKWTGIEYFAQIFSELESNEYELQIFGKGESEVLKMLTRKYNNIILKGFVSDEELLIAMKTSDAFINPRPVDIKDGENNFPSKILEYLKFGKPIISTRTEGLAPYYENLLFFYEPDNKESLIRVLNKIKVEDKEQLRIKIKSFCEEHSWERQTQKLLNFVNLKWR